MSQDEHSGPDIVGVVADANAAGLRHVVIGGFSVIANGYLRATNDSDLLVPDDSQTDEAIRRFFELADARRLFDGKELDPEDIASAPHIRVASKHGIVDVMRGGLAPLDFETVADRALRIELGGEPALVASLSSIVGFKRLAGRARDRNDLAELEAFHGELPVEPIPGLDD
jgi:hypothetical protein